MVTVVFKQPVSFIQQGIRQYSKFIECDVVLFVEDKARIITTEHDFFDVDLDEMKSVTSTKY